MSKPIPFQFDAVVLSSPVQQVLGGEENTRGYRLNVGVFYKYKNRNGSYITDEYAESYYNELIKRNIPVCFYVWLGLQEPQNIEKQANQIINDLANLQEKYGYTELPLIFIYAFIPFVIIVDDDLSINIKLYFLANSFAIVI